MEYNVVELCRFGDFDVIYTDEILLGPVGVDIDDHIESFGLKIKLILDMIMLKILNIYQ